MSQHMTDAIKRLLWLATFSESTWKNNANGETITLPAMIRRGDYYTIGQSASMDIGDENRCRFLGDISFVDSPHKKLVEFLEQYLEDMEKEKMSESF